MSGIHPRRASINFAVIVLSETIDIGRDHLIHRKRSPFPYEGKALTPLRMGLTANIGRSRLSQTSFTTNVVPLPLIGEGIKRPIRGAMLPLSGAAIDY